VQFPPFGRAPAGAARGAGAGALPNRPSVFSHDANQPVVTPSSAMMQLHLAVYNTHYDIRSTTLT
jgi:hypothetical protein